jgi:putative transposase
LGLENGYFYKTMHIPVKCSKEDYDYLMQCSRWSADCWNLLVDEDRRFYEENSRYMNRSELQSFVKNKTPLHAVGNQHVYIKYYTARDAMFASIKAKHENSSKVKLPYKHKKYFVTGWNTFCFKIDYKNKKLYLARKVDENGHPQKQVCCTFKTMSRYVVEIELIYRDGLYFAVKYKEPKANTDIESNNVAAIDLGEIHSISSIDNNGNAIIITGRKLRSIKRLQNKERAKLSSKRSKTIKGSRQYKKYTHAIYRLSNETDKQILDCVHKISKMYLDYCIENDISKVYYGDLDSCTRGHSDDNSKFINQKLRDWCYGLLTLQLENKLSRYGIEFIKISEAYTSQTCPHCGKRHKPTGRNYECECGYKQHRDLVGAMNILNFYEKDIHIERYENLKYLRID